jgi:hypothetical protein
MSNSDKGWPASGAFPFMPFPIPGFWSAPAPAAPAGPASMQPAASAVTSGMEMLTSLWSQLPGSSQVPGFLVPTVDLDELDKRLADLRAAESWVEVNLNMLRATIRGLEVQRHTIAALHSLSTAPPEAPPRPSPTAPAPAPTVAAEPAPAPAPTASEPTAAVPASAAGDWLAYMQDQFSKVAQAAVSATAPAKRAPAATKKAAAKRTRKPASGR